MEGLTSFFDLDREDDELIRPDRQSSHQHLPVEGRLRHLFVRGAYRRVTWLGNFMADFLEKIGKPEIIVDLPEGLRTHKEAIQCLKRFSRSKDWFKDASGTSPRCSLSMILTQTRADDLVYNLWESENTQSRLFDKRYDCFVAAGTIEDAQAYLNKIAVRAYRKLE